MKKIKIVENSLFRYFLLGVGILSVVLGVIGIFLPVMPTTPFLILALWCFFRSSHRLSAWLIDHPILGIYLRYYLDGRGIPWRIKVLAISLLWISISVSAWLLYPHYGLMLLLLIPLLLVTTLILRTPTLEKTIQNK